MSHVDEGTLHAWLDGALDTLPAAEAERVRGHLAACGVCRARLEEERAVRDEAAAILGGAALDAGNPPSFEEMRARARGAGAAPGFRLRRLAWAASVVLALGTGWLLRGGGLPQPVGRADAGTRGEIRGEGAQPASLPMDAPPEATETDAVEPTVDAKSAATMPAEAGPRREAAEVAAGVATPEAVSEPDLDVGSGVVSDVTADAPRPADLWAAAREGREGLVTQRPSPAVSDPLVARQRVEPRVEEARRVVARAASAVPVGAVVVEPAGGSLVVPGLPVVSVAWLDEPGLLGAVQVLQIMETGDTLELVHLPAGVDPARLPAVGDGRTQVRSPRDGGWLVARARVSAEVLSALLLRLEGGG